ncbi:hypothetical protein [Bacillus sp. P14.5]|uniref:hypothetical protein n=1 Tax=Bacillus sp. P14.5 TaxID=1983400 RepID=UPI000DE9AA6A|nr:hypothetical protein [Bacillus sp. P14.5]
MKQNLKAFGIPALVITVLIAALYFHQLSTMTKLPNEGWSRSIPLNYEGKESPITFQRENEVYLTNEDEVRKFTLGEGLTIEESETISMDVPRGYPFWTDGNQFLTLSGGQLSITADGESEVIDEEVTGIATEEEKVLYWKKGVVYEYKLSNGSATEVHTFQNEIMDVVFGNEGSYAVIHQKDTVNAEVFLMTASGELLQSPVLTVKNSTYDQLGSLVLYTEGEEVTFVFGRKMRTGGSLSYNMFKAAGNLDSLETTPLSIHKLNFINEDSGAKLQSPDYARIVRLNGELNLVFTAEGQRIGDDRNIRLYAGELEEGTQIEARAVNTNENVAQNPLKINEESLLWISFNGDFYQLYGASQNSKVKEASTELTAEDWKQSGYNAFLMLFSSMVTLLTSSYWLFPSLTLLLLLYIIRPNIFEIEDINWVEYASIALFLILPFTYMSRAMNSYFYEVAPSYYTFHYSDIFLLGAISLVTGIIWKVGRDPEWGTFAGVFILCWYI